MPQEEFQGRATKQDTKKIKCQHKEGEQCANEEDDDDPFSELLPKNNVLIAARRGMSMPPVRRERVLSQDQVLVKDRKGSDNDSENSRSKASNYHPDIAILNLRKEQTEL